ncbi:TPA: HK97 gp10 family phage protein [Clostridium perfringens]|uniref:HK97 gp10 family phage protein n=1 Tax=Clostridium perfringens TaxID=1502 RepID=A0A8H9QW61_CLOPF|nr:HK97 gp10 family phage protein [Clostridium perfringens]
MSNEEFKNSCQSAKSKMNAQLRKNVNKCCLLVKRDAIKNCPVDMGILRASIFFRTIHNSNLVKGVIASNLEYAPYVHQGTGIYAKDGDGRKTPWKYKVEAGKYKGWHKTVGQKPQPFLEKAKIDNIASIENILKEGLT